MFSYHFFEKCVKENISAKGSYFVANNLIPFYELLTANMKKALKENSAMNVYGITRYIEAHQKISMIV